MARRREGCGSSTLRLRSLDMDDVNIEWAADEPKLSDDEATTPTLEHLGKLERISIENESVSDGSNIEIRRGFRDEDIQSLLQISAGFDPKFDPSHAPRIALLCQTCHTALETVTYLAENEIQRQKLTSSALRVRLWGIDMFNSAGYRPLDELLNPVSRHHTSLRQHLIGVWADIAVTMETILSSLILRTGNSSPESCTQWRRLRIVVGLDDVSAAMHNEFGLPGFLDSGLFYNNHREALDDLIDSLSGLVDCLYDLSVTISTVRQLHRLGYKSNISSLSTCCESEVEGTKHKKEVGEDFLAQSSTAKKFLPNHTSLLISESENGHEGRSGGLQDGLGDDESLHRSESALQGVPKHYDRTTSLSPVAVNDDPIQSKRSSDKHEDPPVYIDMTEASKEPSKTTKSTAEKSGRAPLVNTKQFRKPIKFIDCHARSFSFPFSLCRTWKGMQGLIKEGFQGMTGPYADATRAFIEHGKYDLVSHFDNETIMPSLWNSILEPGMTVRMVLYQFPPDMQYSPPQHFCNIEYNYPPFEHGRKPSTRAFTPSSGRPVRNNVDKENRKGRDDDTKGQKDSRDDDTSLTLSARAGQRPKASSPHPDAPKSIKEISLDEGQNVTSTSAGRKQKEKRNITSSFECRDLRTLDEASYVDSTYSSMDSNVFSYPYPIIEYNNQPWSPFSVLLSTQPVVAPPPLGTSSTKPQFLDRSKEFLELKHMALGEKAAREAIEPTGETIEDKKRAKAEDERFFEKEFAIAAANARLEASKKEAKKERLITDQISAAVIAAVANARLDSSSKEEKKPPTELAKLEAEIKGRPAASTASANPKPIHFIDCIGRKYTFPYQYCSTWKGMEDLIKHAFVHVESIRPQVLEGYYDLLGPSAEIISPACWESLVEPDLAVTMMLWPTSGFESQPTGPQAPKLPNPDPKAATNPSALGSQALGNTPSDSHISTPPSAQSIHGSEIVHRLGIMNSRGASTQSDVKRSTAPKHEAHTSNSSSENEESVGEEFDSRSRMSKWKDRVFRPLRAGKFAAAQRELKDD